MNAGLGVDMSTVVPEGAPASVLRNYTFDELKRGDSASFTRIVIQSTLEQKRDICQNAIELMHTVMAALGQVNGAKVDGPLAFDHAIGPGSARTKGGPQGIFVNALSPGPLKTRAAPGIDHLDELIDRARAPERQLVTIADVGVMAAGLVSDFARDVTGSIAYVDAGYHVMS
jgi:hypothetical protein